MRHIPGTMATQHPDNASAPFWNTADQPFVGVHQEITEAVSCFRDLGVGEYMWDWEGKHADATVIDRLLSDHYAYFSKHQLGRDKFLTFRIPNTWEEKGYNLLQAMSVILSSEDLARDLKLGNRPLFEVILPMTERADQLLHMQKLFQQLARFKSEAFTPDMPVNNDYMEIIPLVESVDSQVAVANLLQTYVSLHEKHFKRRPQYIRPFMACSDSALTSGFLAGLLGNKLSLARMYEFGKASGIPVFPIAGPGSLTFRGGLAPQTIDRFLTELPGVRTVSVQSSFRYDHPKSVVRAAVAKLEQQLPKAKPLHYTPDQQKRITAIIATSAQVYKDTIHGLLPDMEGVFRSVPKRRDRRQHIGLLSYGRSMDGQSLPRAITFSAGFYSVGVPPEFIALGRTLRALNATNLKLLHAVYPSLRADMERAGRFLSKDSLGTLSRRNSVWVQVQTDVQDVQELLGVRLGPRTGAERAHKQLAHAVLELSDSPSVVPSLIDKMASLRKSMG